MARTVKPLTDIKIKNAKAKDKTYSLYDGDGLQIEIRTTGIKTWIFRYMSIVSKKVVKITLGKYPIISLVEARDKKIEFYKMLKDGIDPKTHLDYPKTSTILNDILEQYSDKLQKELSPNTFKRDFGIIKKDISHHLGKKDINEITRFDIINMLRKIEKRGSLVALDRTLGLCRRFWKWMVSIGFVEHNIALDIDKSIFKKHKVSNFPHLTDIGDIKELYTKIKTYQDHVTRNALLFGMHTFLRAFNIRHLEWKEIDFDKKFITIEADKMKMRKGHLVPITDQVKEILLEMKPYNAQYDFVFATLRGGKVMSDATMNKALDRLGYKGIQTTHGFRHSASTILHENIHIHKIQSDAIERQLAHTDSSIRGVYNKAQYIEERIELMSWWSELLVV